MSNRSKHLRQLERKILDLALRMGFEDLIDEVHGSHPDPDCRVDDRLDAAALSYAKAVRADEARRRVLGTPRSRLKVPREIDRELRIGYYSINADERLLARRRFLGLPISKGLRDGARWARAQRKRVVKPEGRSDG